MLRFVVGYLATGLSFALIDAVWLTQMGPRLYRPTLDPVLAPAPHLAPAIVFYLVYILGVVLLAVLPAVKDGVWTAALTKGVLLGALAYATYDLTNQATLKVWSTSITLADVAWGAFATGLATLVGFFAVRAVSGRG